MRVADRKMVCMEACAIFAEARHTKVPAAGAADQGGSVRFARQTEHVMSVELIQWLLVIPFLAIAVISVHVAITCHR